MRYGTRNKIHAKVISVKSDGVMSLAKFEILSAKEMSSVLTTESVEEMELKPGDVVELLVKAIHVLPVKE